MKLLRPHGSLALFMLMFIMVAAALFAGCNQSQSTTNKSEPKATQQNSEKPASEEASHDSDSHAQNATETVAEHKHAKPGETCFICDPSKRDKGRLWCKEHNRYEDRYWICHPEQQDKNRLFCKEHNLYEDECFLCHPELLEKKSAPQTSNTVTLNTANEEASNTELLCKEHGVPEKECAICHPELLTKLPPGKGLKLHLPTEESASKAGIAAQVPEVNGMLEGVECVAELEFNQNKLAEITPLVEGVIKSIAVDLGSHVKEGDVLARIASSTIGDAQGAYLKAKAEEQLRAKTMERKHNLVAQHIAPEKDLQEAQAAHESALAAMQQAQQQLKLLGFEGKQLSTLAERNGTPGSFEIRAPFDGELIERNAVQGALATTGKSLFTLADTSSLWAMVSIPESQLTNVKKGQKVELRIESLPDKIFTGTLTWLAPKIDERTRMARGRVEVANTEGQLKAQMFAKALIITSSSDQAINVPQTALQSISGMSLVFVEADKNLYEARPVKLGGKRDGRVEILSGLKAREPVVVTGSYALKSQFLISRLGAGCCE